MSVFHDNARMNILFPDNFICSIVKDLFYFFRAFVRFMDFESRVMNMYCGHLRNDTIHHLIRLFSNSIADH